MLPHHPALLFVLLTGATACPLINSTLNSSLDRRSPWHGVGNPGSNEPNTVNAWPVDPTDPSKRALRYCWVAQTDYDNLNPTLQKSIALWQPAIGTDSELYSNLVIRPDGAEKKADILCSNAAGDALQISDMGGVTGGLQAHCSIGYADERITHLKEKSGRHSLAFARVDKTSDPQRPTAIDISVMAHELGHALGLEHEHQRPDRDNWLSFFCENLVDYEDVKKKIEAPDTIEKACTDRDTAKKYNFLAFHYMPVDLGLVMGRNAWSKIFDYNSIMTYSSYDGSTRDGDKDYAVLLRHAVGKNWPHEKGLGDEFYPGGAPRDKAENRKISIGDMARIAQLYPVDTDVGKQRAALPSWKGTSLLPEKRAVETGRTRAVTEVGH